MQRVLVVDDKLTMQIMLRDILEQRGYEVAVMENSLSRLDSMDVAPDLVVADLDRLATGAVELATIETLRDAFPEVPILALSANAFPSERAIIERWGRVCCLNKPVDFAVLVKLIDMLVADRRPVQKRAPKRPLVFSGFAAATHEYKEVS